MTKFLIVTNTLLAVINYIVFIVGLSSAGNPIYIFNFIVGSFCWYTACRLMLLLEED